jgi:hypothetical protein
MFSDFKQFLNQSNESNVSMELEVFTTGSHSLDKCLVYNAICSYVTTIKVHVAAGTNSSLDFKLQTISQMLEPWITTLKSIHHNL